MKILAVQLDIAWEDPQANFEKVEKLLADAKPEPNTLVVLPEMFATGFSMSMEATEPEGGPIASFLQQLAQRWQVTLVGGVAINGHNRALVFAPNGTRIADYTKIKPFAVGGETYAPGKQQVVFSWAELRVTPFICYDLRFPEVWRVAAAAWRPELYLDIASWPSARAHHWVRLLQARAIENQAYVLGVNRCGTDPYFSFPGRTMLVDWHGEIVADAGSEEKTLLASLDLPALHEYRSQLRFLDDI
jgi:omega-amidase